ncbi:hypothetical protein [Bacteroides congonensis]|uniref:hypothetical protein n=1 Tax=Bacteroides congonensis TaxID=1871006 RepID=UPI00189A0F4F|nr:hypothetical protein [Bacteroides congonensis]
MIVDIKDIYGNIRFSTPVNKGSRRKLLLMKEDYITLKFSLDNPIYFHLGDGIDNELGIFELVDLYKPIYNSATGGYDYDLRLDAYYWKWKNKKFFYRPEDVGREAGWNLTATLDTHLNVFLDNLKVLGYKYREEEFIWDIDDTVTNASKLVSYDNVNLIDALTQMAETWECEWWIENHKICFGRCEYSSPVDFKVGDLIDTESVNVNSMQRSDSQTKYATRVYAFGSTRNIPVSYRRSLIFDVKEIEGRYISDTSRPLNNIFFPTSTKNEGGLNPDFPNSMYHFYANEAIALVVTKRTIGSLLEGKYKIKINSFSCEFFGGDRTNGIKDFVKLRAWLTYNAEGITKQIDIFSIEKSIPETPAGIGVFLEIPSKELEFTLPKCENIVIYSEWSTRRVRTTDTYNVGMFLHNYSPASAYSNSVIITFLTGHNAGESYQAIYNPTFIPDSDGNPIQLPEDVTASLGDRYIIDNIIKGKVPDNYFSKDDKELTLNGVVQKRLMLPEGISYVDAYRYSSTGKRIDIGDEQYDNPDNIEMPKEEAIEEIVTFEDEYPKYIGSTTVVPKPELEDEKVDDKPTGNKYPIYTFKDTGLKNFTKDFLLEELHLIFQTGKLAGLDFVLNVKESDNTGTTFVIVRNNDYGRYLPDDVLFPQADHMEDGKEVLADTYILYGFDTAFISEQMLPDAEQKLLDKTKEYVKKTMIDPSTYSCEMDSTYIYNNGNISTFEIGDKVNLINKTYFPEGRQSRIIGFEWPLDIPYDHPIYTVGETAAYSRLGEIESKLNSLTYKGQTYSGSAVGGGGTSVYVIGVNDKTLPSDRNVFSSRKSLKTFLNKTEPDTAVGHVTFENGILVRKQEIMEAATMALIEENDAIVEELAIRSDVTTLGEINNVSKEADEPSETNDLIVRLAGASEWTVNTSLFADVSQLMEKVFPFTISFAGGGIYEKGSIRTINLTWDYDRDITSQAVNGEVIAIDIRTKQYTDVVSDSTYNLSAVYDGQTYTKSTSVEFRLKKYYGVSAHETLTDEEVLALNASWAVRVQSSTVFDCTGGKYPYYILPASMASGIQFWIGGLRNSDWTAEVRDITNTYGHTESYTIFRLNSIQTGVLNIEVE